MCRTIEVKGRNEVANTKYKDDVLLYLDENSGSSSLLAGENNAAKEMAKPRPTLKAVGFQPA